MIAIYMLLVSKFFKQIAQRRKIFGIENFLEYDPIIQQEFKL